MKTLLLSILVIAGCSEQRPEKQRGLITEIRVMSTGSATIRTSDSTGKQDTLKGYTVESTMSYYPNGKEYLGWYTIYKGKEIVAQDTFYAYPTTDNGLQLP